MNGVYNHFGGDSYGTYRYFGYFIGSCVSVQAVQGMNKTKNEITKDPKEMSKAMTAIIQVVRLSIISSFLFYPAFSAYGQDIPPSKCNMFFITCQKGIKKIIGLYGYFLGFALSGRPTLLMGLLL
jgi:hypothetical protein